MYHKLRNISTKKLEEIPNINRASNILDIGCGTRETLYYIQNYWNFYSDPTHVRPWTKRSLKTLGEMSGFEIYKTGIIRWWEFFLLLPVISLLNILTKSNFSFIPFELAGRTVFFIGKKD